MFVKVKQIMSSEEIKQLEPVTPQIAAIKARRDEEAKAILRGDDKRLMVIVGPCSADNEPAVCDYVYRLAGLAEKIKDKIFVIPRIYTNKPRIQAGIIALRKMHLRAIAESGLSAADEMLYPENHVYLDDLLTYVAVGARSSEDQQHRLVASGVDIPCGIKNPMNGSFPVTLNSIYAAQIANEFKYRTCQVRTEGNPYAHAILRGSVDVYGNNIPNYHYEDLMRFIDMYEKQELKNPAVIVDTNHSNSGKNYIEQIRIVKEVVDNIRHNDRIRRYVRGFLIESYIEDGAQPVTGCEYGKSVTDPCLGWEKTERLLLDVADKL